MIEASSYQTRDPDIMDRGHDVVSDGPDLSKEDFLKADLPGTEAHPEISPPMISTRIRPLLMTQPAIQVVMILEATLHRIVEGLTIKSLEILRNRSMGQKFSHSRTVGRRSMRF
jgi:hypothetical protein